MDPDAEAVAGTLDTAVIVLAGGGSRRWGGQRKTAALLGGKPVLSHVLAAVPRGIPVVVVGPRDHADEADEADEADGPQRWTREDPPGGGPVAGLAAGCAALPAGVGVLIVLAGDLPFAGTAVGRLRDALTQSDPDRVDAVIAVDPGGRDQPLLAAYRVAPLVAALGPGEGAAGRSLHAVLSALRLARVPVSAREAFDLDTPEDLRLAADMLAGYPAGSPSTA